MFQLCEITNQDSLYYNITVEEWETLLKSFFFLGVNMNSHYLYQIAKRNLKDLLEFITQQQNKLDNVDTVTYLYGHYYALRHGYSTLLI